MLLRITSSSIRNDTVLCTTISLLGTLYGLQHPHPRNICSGTDSRLARSASVELSSTTLSDRSRGYLFSEFTMYCTVIIAVDTKDWRTQTHTLPLIFSSTLQNTVRRIGKLKPKPKTPLSFFPFPRFFVFSCCGHIREVTYFTKYEVLYLEAC